MFFCVYSNAQSDSKFINRTIYISNLKVKKIIINIPGKIKITQGANSINIKSLDSIINHIKFSPVGDKYVMKINKNNYNIKDDIYVHIKVPNIEYIENIGSGSINIESFKNQKKLDLNLKGSGGLKVSDFNFDNKASINVALLGSGGIRLEKINGANDMNVSISGSGSISAKKFKVEKAYINLQGSGNYYGEDLESKYYKALLMGSGNIKVGVSDNLEAKLTGTGSIYYKGNPKVSKQVTGTGSVIKQ